MRSDYETPVTAERLGNASLSGPAGVWTLDGDALIAADSDGPATVLVPTEAVRLLAVDLPIANRAKRLAALPFAIEDMIAEPIEAVHIAIGAELSPKRYLVAVVRHDRMVEWIARVEDGGLDHAALVPDALALPRPGEGEWAVDLGATRAVVRRGDGTGLAIPAPLLATAWAADGSPRATGYGAPLPEVMAGATDALAVEPLGRRLLAPAIDLRQGRYARRRRSMPGLARRFVQVAAIGILAHAGIATADTIALKRIAAERAADTRALVLEKAPGANIPDDNLAGAVADLLPQPGAGATGGNAFLPVITRISGALQPLQPAIATQAMTFQGNVLTIDLEGADPALAGRVDQALKGAGVRATVTMVGGGARITVTA